MSSEKDRVLCCIALWVLIIFIWRMPEDAYSMDKKDTSQVQLQKAVQDIRAGKMEQAFQMVNTIINNSPDLPDAYLTLGNAYDAQGDVEHARQAYRIYVEKLNYQFPRDPEILLRLRHYGLY